MNWDLIPRNNYLDFLIRNRDLKIIKVITGVRRCGKSTLFTLFYTLHICLFPYRGSDA